MTSATNNKKVKRRGRPRVAKEHAHSRQVIVRIKNEDYKAFSEAAAKNKQTLSEWMRATLRGAVQER